MAAVLELAVAAAGHDDGEVVMGVAVAVGGTSVAVTVGGSVGTIVGVGAGVAAEHAVIRTARTTGKNLLNTLCILNLQRRYVLQTQNAGTSRPNGNRDAPASLYGKHYALESNVRQYVVLLIT